MTLPVLYDARLVEQVVLQAARQLAPESAREFHLERERAYEIADQQERETAFRAVFSRWFHALDRARELALAETPTLMTDPGLPCGGRARARRRRGSRPGARPARR
jgi:hypothetical protein